MNVNCAVCARVVIELNGSTDGVTPHRCVKNRKNVNAQEGLGRSEPANPAPFLADGRGVGETLSQSNAFVRRTHGVIRQSVRVLQPWMTRGSRTWAGASND